jgi:FAD:protein FMN transferase
VTARSAVTPGTAPATRRTWVETVMGLPVSVTVRGPAARGGAADRAVQALLADLHRADRVFSTYRPDSEVSLLRSGALARELASPDVREVLALCEQARTLSGGAFDAEVVRPDGRRLLDPSGLVKGWAVERAARALDVLDTDWLVNAGGDVLGRAVYGPAWRVAVEDPRDRTRVLCVLPLRAGAVATSGTAARGRHLLDPRTGLPVAEHLLSATVVGPSLTWADVLATAAFVEGPAALQRVTALVGHEALLVLPDGARTSTAGLRAATSDGGC